MTPQDAAQRFIELVIRTTFSDVLDLTDRVGLDNEAPVRARQLAYAEVEAAVRRRFRVTHDLDALEQAVHLAAPEAQRADVAMAVTRLTDAVTDELTVKQQAGYVVGVAVGCVLDSSVARTVAAGWTPPAHATQADATSSAGRLVLDAVIVQEDAPLVPERPYVVWFTLEGHPRNKGFVVGSFETFDAAAAALLAVDGVRVAHIRSEEGDR